MLYTHNSSCENYFPVSLFWRENPFLVDLKQTFCCVSSVLIHRSSVRIAGGLGLNPPYLILPTPYLWSKFDPGGSVSTPHLRFAEVSRPMLLDSHFLLMQFLKYLQLEKLNVTTILIRIEDQGCPLPDCPLNFY